MPYVTDRVIHDRLNGLRAIQPLHRLPLGRAAREFRDLVVHLVHGFNREAFEVVAGRPAINDDDGQAATEEESKVLRSLLGDDTPNASAIQQFFDSVWQDQCGKHR